MAAATDAAAVAIFASTRRVLLEALREEVLPNIPWVLELPISRLVAERVAVAVAVARSESDLPMFGTSARFRLKSNLGGSQPSPSL